ncbi:MAG: SpoIIE family protein phosphatase [Crinalium sp.]
MTSDRDSINELHTQIQYRLIEKLSESERRYRELVENLREIVFKCNQVGKLTFLNRAWSETLGYSQAESLERSLVDFLHPEDREIGFALISPSSSQNAVDKTTPLTSETTTASTELRFYHKNGELLWLELSGSYNSKEGLSGSLIDITERKQAKKLLEDYSHTLEEEVKERTAQLSQANAEIIGLNERLKAENLRMSAELAITRQLQQMILPKDNELSEIEGLEIAGFMEPADEVGGDYYDVVKHDGRVKIGIGDVTGHGLESGVLMIMAQTAVRTLLANNETDPVNFLNVVNRTLYDNVQRMNSDKTLTLCLLDYHDRTLHLSGQHEEMLVVRNGGVVERIDTIDLGFPIGLEPDISDFVAETQVHLNPGDLVVLYTDGITEAENIAKVPYGLERLCEVIQNNWQSSAAEIKQIVIEDVREHIGEQKVYDDITLLVLKQQ